MVSLQRSFDLRMTSHGMCRHMPSPEGEVASQYEDRILETLKKVGAHVDSAVGAFTNLSHLGDRGTKSQVQPCLDA